MVVTGVQLRQRAVQQVPTLTSQPAHDCSGSPYPEGLYGRRSRAELAAWTDPCIFRRLSGSMWERGGTGVPAGGAEPYWNLPDPLVVQE